MEKFEKVLIYLRDNHGSALRSAVLNEALQKNGSANELNELLNGPLSGLVKAETEKTVTNSKQIWKLTSLGWEKAHALDRPPHQEVQPAQPEAIPEGFAKFREFCRLNPEMSVQAALQRCGRHLGDPLEDSEYWREFRTQNPDWYLKQPKDWYPSDVQLDEHGYPMRFPTDPLTVEEQRKRPTTPKGWFDWTMKQPGASLEPLGVAMSAAEVANTVRVTKKVGQANALDIFGQGKLTKAHELAGLPLGENTVLSAF